MNVSMTIRMAGWLACALLVNSVSAQAPPPQGGDIYGPTTLHATGALSSGRGSFNDLSGRRLTINQRLEMGDDMTANPTHNGQIIQNRDGTTPTWFGTVTPIPGVRPPIGLSIGLWSVINGLAVTDIHQTHWSHRRGFTSGTMQIASLLPAAPAPAAPGAAGAQPLSAPLGDWLFGLGFINDESLVVPDFLADVDLYYGVDAAVWAASGFAVGDQNLDETFSVVDGVSAALPGFLFSTSPLTFGATGWETSTPFSGEALLDSYHSFAVTVPEPAGIASAALGLLMLSAMRRRSSRAGRPR